MRFTQEKQVTLFVNMNRSQPVHTQNSGVQSHDVCSHIMRHHLINPHNRLFMLHKQGFVLIDDKRMTLLQLKQGDDPTAFLIVPKYASISQTVMKEVATKLPHIHGRDSTWVDSNKLNTRNSRVCALVNGTDFYETAVYQDVAAVRGIENVSTNHIVDVGVANLTKQLCVDFWTDAWLQDVWERTLLYNGQEGIENQGVMCGTRTSPRDSNLFQKTYTSGVQRILSQGVKMP